MTPSGGGCPTCGLAAGSPSYCPNCSPLSAAPGATPSSPPLERWDHLLTPTRDPGSSRGWGRGWFLGEWLGDFGFTQWIRIGGALFGIAAFLWYWQMSRSLESDLSGFLGGKKECEMRDGSPVVRGLLGGSCVIKGPRDYSDFSVKVHLDKGQATHPFSTGTTELADESLPLKPRSEEGGPFAEPDAPATIEISTNAFAMPNAYASGCTDLSPRFAPLQVDVCTKTIRTGDAWSVGIFRPGTGGGLRGAQGISALALLDKAELDAAAAAERVVSTVKRAMPALFAGSMPQLPTGGLGST